MFDTMTAKCGLVCTECESYIATVANDVDELTRLADEANERFNLSMTWEDSKCFGCQSTQKKIGYCDSCEVRICAVERGVETCAHCDSYGCEIISKFFEMVPKAEENLGRIRETLF